MFRTLRRLATPILKPYTSKPMSKWTRLVRFVPKSGEGDTPLIGEPVDPSQDVGMATYNGDVVEVDVFSGSSVVSPGQRTGRKEVVGHLLSLLDEQEVGTIRCIGLNYHSHAKEMSMPVPEVPSVFLKPSAALAGPYPDQIVLPKAYAQDDAADWESELALVLGRDCKNISEEGAMEALLGYTAANDVSSRIAQFATTQWDHSKGFDGSCPIGPVLLNKTAIEDFRDLHIIGSWNGRTVQDCKLDDIIFPIPKIISFLSRGTTLKAGTVIITGTPPGVGWGAKQRQTMHDGDEFRVWLSHGVGTLINKVVNEP